MTQTVPSAQDREVKARLRGLWALGDYASVATEIIPALGTTLVEACGVGPGQRVLDVAAGSGNAAIPAALAGADVVACDLTPELLEAGARLAEGRGARLEWREGDAEDLPFDDGEFDVVMSCVGVMFAPRHEQSAGELVRTCSPGGTIGLVSWTPEGFVGQMLATMKPYAAPPPPGAQPPPLWGREEHVVTLFGDRVVPMNVERRTLVVDHFADGESFRDYFKQRYGPTIATYRRIADDPDRVAALDHDLAELARRHQDSATGAMDWEYLLFTGRRA